RDMNVHYPGLRELHDGGKLLRRHRAQAVRRDADSRSRQRLHGMPARLEDAREALHIAHEAPLARCGRCTPETAVRIENWQQCDPDAPARGGSDDAARELAWVCEGCAVSTVVQIVELADMGEARLEHLGEAQRADRLELLGTDALEKTVHQ